jgi:transposase-like protein
VAGKRPGCPARRTFTAAYKARILAAFDALPEGSPERGAILRQERLYHSHIEHWRKQREAGRLSSSAGNPAKDAESAELARLRAENKKLKASNERLAGELGKTKTALDIAGKSIRAVGGHLEQRELRRELNQVIDAHFPAMEEVTGTSRACRILGKSRASLYRQRKPAPAQERPPRGPFHIRPNCPGKSARTCWRCWTRRGSRTSHRHADHHHACPGAARECDLRTVDRQCPARVH